MDEADLREMLVTMQIDFARHHAREEQFQEQIESALLQNVVDHKIITEKLEARLVAEVELKSQVRQLSKEAGQRGSIIGGCIVAFFSLLGTVAMRHLFK